MEKKKCFYCGAEIKESETFWMRVNNSCEEEIYCDPCCACKHKTIAAHDGEI